MPIFVIRRHCLRGKAAVVVMMVILRALLSVVIMVMWSFIVRAFTTNIYGMMTLSNVVGIRNCEDAGIESDQHAKTHQPCEE
jgi:hypothetical protein